MHDGIDSIDSTDSTDSLDSPVRPRRHTVLAVAVVVALVVVGLFVVLATREPGRNTFAESPLLGNAAPALTGETLDGGTFDLDGERGRWVVVNFFASWCAPCRQEHPELVSFARRHEEGGDAVVVSVVYNDDTAAVREYFDANGGDWPVVVGDTGADALEWGVAGVPESYVVDPLGFVRLKVIGGVTATGLDRALAQLEGGG
jgi:cytochrome c biogenesis protein CcmG/thiol:disulfide interchange protein DsbE